MLVRESFHEHGRDVHGADVAGLLQLDCCVHWRSHQVVPGLQGADDARKDRSDVDPDPTLYVQSRELAFLLDGAEHLLREGQDRLASLVRILRGEPRHKRPRDIRIANRVHLEELPALELFVELREEFVDQRDQLHRRYRLAQHREADEVQLEHHRDLGFARQTPGCRRHLFRNVAGQEVAEDVLCPLALDLEHAQLQPLVPGGDFFASSLEEDDGCEEDDEWDEDPVPPRLVRPELGACGDEELC
mmetsp:Transcript_4601/g.11038  ORF Transcript_4601/g.11038 Transcript_4601/m.11038 type:complete len:246 (-) Transcript_4601:548-1285(-)